MAFSLVLPAHAADQDSSPFIAKNSISIKPEEYSGAFVYSYPLTIPPGRNGLQPSLSLSYNSGDTSIDGLAGYGWNLSVPKIERLNKRGVDDLYDRHDFTSSLGGELEDISLSDGKHGTYGAKVDDGSYLTYTYNTDDTWTVTDKRGTEYTFGDDTDAQVVDSGASTHIYAWYLTKIEDLNGNTVTYTYSKDDGRVYPESINYGGNGSSSGIFDISFTLESRDDATESFASGFSVKTQSRVSAITVEVDSDEVREYDLDYTTGDNEVRSLLSSITETGTIEGGASIAKEPTTFDYSASSRSWTEDTGFTFPFAIGNNGSSSLGVYMFDVNADGLPDIVKSTNYERHVYMNNGDTTWTEDTSYTVPIAFLSAIGRDMGVRIMDVDGDGFLDIVKARYNSVSTLEDAVYINNGDGTGWTEDASISVPIAFVNDGGSDRGVHFMDVDGDGMQDIVGARYLGGPSDRHVYINNGDGTGWTEDAGYTIPLDFTIASGTDIGVRIIDVNGDSLPDLIQSRNISGGGETKRVFINDGDGTGWTEDTGYTIPITFVLASGTDRGARFVDLNGDSLVDIIYSRYNSTGVVESGAYINNGDDTGWTEDTSFTAPIAFANTSGQDIGIREDDLGGDMLTDILYSRMDSSGSTWTDKFFKADGVRADLLTNIALPTGGETAVAYQPSTIPNPGLFFPLEVVDTITTDDGLGHTSTSSYEYEDGDYYYNDEYDRKFAGFGKVTNTDGAGNVTIDYFHQGNSTDSTHGESTDDVSKLGKRYREEVYDDADNLYRVTIDNWTNEDLGDDRDFVFKDQTLELVYDGDSDHTDRALQYDYDTDTGNLMEVTDWGKVDADDDGTYTDTWNDSFSTAYTYADWSSDSSASGFKSTETLKDRNGNTDRETKYYYDGLSFGSVSDGNMTTESKWIWYTHTSDTVYTYDSYGLVATVTDPDGNTTTFTPDSHHLYPAEQENALAQTKTFTYDYSSGKVLTMTDENGFDYENTYDGFDRPLTEKQPDASSPTTLVNKKVYAYNDSSFPNSVHETTNFDSSNAEEAYTYVDGFGRVIQRREEVPGTYNVTDTAYDERGNVQKTSLPYTSSGSTRTSPTTTATLYETMTYDALGRVTESTNAAGTTTKVYDQNSVEETDAEGNVKTYTNDGHNRLQSVVENNDSEQYNTSYAWNNDGSLAGIHDAEENFRAFVYDNLGRRTGATDLAGPDDRDYGFYNYTYDDAGNMLTSVNPNGITTTYTYDELNRVTSEDADSTTGTDITYTYDTCTNGVGKLCAVDMLTGADTVYAYDALGRTTSEEKTIDSTAYTTAYEYDRQGTVTSVTYPDSSEATYGFDTQGRVDDVTFVDSDTTSTNVVTDITYGPHGKVTHATYGNGVESDWSYDSAELYRLSNLTTVSGTDEIENFDYSFDNVGNLTELNDSSSLYAGMDIAYDYDDLYRLLSADSTSTDTALDYTKSWTYSSIGNILSSTDKGTYTYGGTATGDTTNPHAPKSVGSTDFTYDTAGNMLTDGTWTNTWNYKNQLTESSNGRPVTYAYDHDGNRVKTASTFETGTTIYPNQYYTVTPKNTLRNVFAGALGNVATFSWDGAAVATYHHRDHLGSAHVETDASGSVSEYIIYSPFGDTLYDSKTDLNETARFKYTGKEKDRDTGWYYYGARYYNAGQGQFLSEDPAFWELGTDYRQLKKTLLDPQALNSYAYARNNPIRFNDPDGKNFWDSLKHGFISALNIITAVAPIASDIRDFTEALTGKDLITGQQLSEDDKQMTAIMLVGFPALASGKEYRVARDLDEAAGAAIHGTRNLDWTRKIGSGHAFEKHVIQGGEFEGITTVEEFTAHIDEVVNNPTATKSLRDGRTGYWYEPSGTVVVHDPNSVDGGSAFRPDTGVDYFNNDLQ